ncbi:uncharacterized protein zbbx isoform X2 [Salminus brasiliensis]|uniref:uncharacterized protein zbbx isoform X2 n=1 Tax=Salminus brasiliensis TaxID=930266 RepID=UPI003B832B14
MNLNDFVVLPNKPKSVKLNVRNLRELRMETVHLDQENKDMENRLQELREIMRKSGALRWKSAQANSGLWSKEKGVKLSAGKKIRVLKEDSLQEAHRPSEKVPGPPPPRDPGPSRKPRLKGKLCGQCEVRTAGLVCAECGEDYCVGCFARFHQKGALKHHRMIPVQAELQTTVSSLDVLSRFQKQIGEERTTSSQSTYSSVVSPAEGRTYLAGQPVYDPQTHCTQILFVNEGEELEDEGLLSGCFDEEESAKSFQQALNEWRERNQAEKHMVPVTVEMIGTQAGERVQQPIHIEFREHSLSYMEKLLLKKHRRTSIEPYCPLPALSSLQDSLAHSPTQPAEESHELTAEEVNLHKYCVALFAMSSPAGGEQPDKTDKSCLSITEIDETVGDCLVFGASGVKQGHDNKKVQAEEEDMPCTAKPLTSSYSSPTRPVERAEIQSPEPLPTSPSSDQFSSFIKSQKLQGPNSEDLIFELTTSQLKLSADQQIEHEHQRTDLPRQDNSPKPQTARRSAPLEPEFRLTETDLSSSPVSSMNNLCQGSPDAQNTGSFLLPPSRSPSPVYPLSSGPKLSRASLDYYYSSSKLISPSARPLMSWSTSHSPTPSPRSVVMSTTDSPNLSPIPVPLKSTTDFPTQSPRPIALKSTTDFPTQSPRPVVLKSTADFLLSRPLPVVRSTADSPTSSPRPAIMKCTTDSPTPSPRPVVLRSTADFLTPRPLPVAKCTTDSPTPSPKRVVYKSTVDSLTPSPIPVILTSTADSPNPSPIHIALKSTSYSPTFSPMQVILTSTTPSSIPAVMKSTTDSPIPNSSPVVLKSTTDSPTPCSLPVVLTSTADSQTPSPSPVVLKSTADSPNQSPGPVVLKCPSQSSTLSPQPSNTQSQCISSMFQQRSDPLPTLSLQSIEDDSLALEDDSSDCSCPLSSPTMSTYLYKSSSQPSIPLFPSLSLSDSDSLSEGVGLISDEDSSDEEIKRCVSRDQQEKEEEKEKQRNTPSLHPALSSSTADAPLYLLDSGQETNHSGLFTEPSQALISLAHRKTCDSQSYQGLEGFFTLGLDPNSVQSSPAPPQTPTETHTLSQALMTGQGSWRPTSCLSHYAKKELVDAVINNQPIRNSSRCATPISSLVPPWKQNLSGFSSRNTPSISRPKTVDPTMTPVFRPLSRTAEEIMEVQTVELKDEEEDEDDKDYQTLAGLEEELRQMSAEP